MSSPAEEPDDKEGRRLMGVNVYLRESIRETEGFENKDESGGKPLQKWQTPYFKGIRLTLERGRYAFHLFQLIDEIPESVVEFVTDISVMETLPSEPVRKSGVYRYEGAEAELDVNLFRKNELELRIVGKTMEGVRILYRLIRSGKIQPTESWEEEQQTAAPSGPEVADETNPAS